ncbi:GntR family transcriptional regulator [Thiolapillus brandeum]|uniref:Transcriptional regulator, GntR family n=1 Tax=Thiolapillus brandeum TaxID=1076588 RepID=A0A7U6GHT1_9GAMM|nr:FCD domain-containing protein [Thiolapillus brandeum]BAO43859.1 transcriptional regulator, GntR family [Thiolapillus brandeum]
MLTSAKKQPTTLTEDAYLRIRNDIVQGRLTAGEKLRIEALRNTYGIGPTPLREALSRLLSDGFVTTEGQRGFSVTPLTAEDLEDVTSMRVLLENRALQNSILKGDDNWEANLVAAFHRLSRIETSEGERDPVEWERRNAEFHQALIGACHSHWLRRFAAILYDQHRRYRHLARARLKGRDLHAEHTAIYEAALKRDVEAACAANERHIQATFDTLRDLISEEDHLAGC